MTGSNDLEKLPIELIVAIFEQLDIPSLLAASAVSAECPTRTLQRVTMTSDMSRVEGTCTNTLSCVFYSML